MKLINELKQLNEDKQYPSEIKKEVAREGATIADDLQNAGRRWDGSNSEQVELQIMKSTGRKFVKKGGPKIADALANIAKVHQENGKAFDKARDAAQAFEKTHGFSVIYAWEAANQTFWPYYKMMGMQPKNGSKVKLI